MRITVDPVLEQRKSHGRAGIRQGGAHPAYGVSSTLMARRSSMAL
jgi:hypothetical protein